MKLLIVTQTVDTEDPVLGFFVRWIEELAKRAERVEVICLAEGKYDPPDNVRVHSLGKERGRPLFGALAYAVRFKWLAWRLRRGYDAVFVHMNQEYVLIAGPLWRFLGKRVYLWRNHYAGSWKTDLAVAFCTKVFCTSKHSYTARFKKTILMPVGVDTERFHPGPHAKRKRGSILFLARMAPSKRPDILLDALAMLARDNVHFTAAFVGSPLPQDASYYAGLRARASTLGFGDSVSFLPAVPNGETPALYRAHEIFVNCSPSGMFDKTLFEAAACGCRVLTASADFAALAGEDFRFDSAAELAARLAENLAEPAAAQPAALRTLAEDNALPALARRLAEVMGKLR